MAPGDVGGGEALPTLALGVALAEAQDQTGDEGLPGALAAHRAEGHHHVAPGAPGVDQEGCGGVETVVYGQHHVSAPHVVPAWRWWRTD